jgi:hypothetical protein
VWLPLTPPAFAPLRRASQPARHSVSDGGHPLPAPLRFAAQGEGVRGRRAPAFHLHPAQVVKIVCMCRAAMLQYPQRCRSSHDHAQTHHRRRL